MFLQPSQYTIATLSHDYPDWHQGREHYALWYIDIQQPEILDYLHDLRQQFADVLLQPNIRQFHITLFVCGFLTENSKKLDDDFPEYNIKLQQQLLEQLQLQPIILKIGAIQSFDSALYIEILDHQNSLSKIRHQFYKQHQEPAPLKYTPHITLGLYHSEFKGSDIFNKIKHIEQKTFQMNVKHLSFGIYKAKILQGELYPIQQFSLQQHSEIQIQQGMTGLNESREL